MHCEANLKSSKTPALTIKREKERKEKHDIRENPNDSSRENEAKKKAHIPDQTFHKFTASTFGD